MKKIKKKSEDTKTKIEKLKKVKDNKKDFKYYWNETIRALIITK
ncbi:hypothetical protein [Priestia flexa]|nr:hypothetical protein [Priestia flexa]